MKKALRVCRAENFADWHQEVIREADLAANSSVRGCMVIKAWGYAIWENRQQKLDRLIKETGHDNCYFPIFISLEHITASIWTPTDNLITTHSDDDALRLLPKIASRARRGVTG